MTVIQGPLWLIFGFVAIHGCLLGVAGFVVPNEATSSAVSSVVRPIRPLTSSSLPLKNLPVPPLHYRMQDADEDVEQNILEKDELEFSSSQDDLVPYENERTTPALQDSSFHKISSTILGFKKLLEQKNRPRRLTVSTHSAFSTVVTAFFFGALGPHLSPGFHENGLPRVYDMVNFDNAFLAKTTALMFAISAVTGVLRLPPQTTKLRRLMFESCAWATVLMYTMQDSNFFMIDGGYSLDIFDGPAWCITFFVFCGTIISTLEYLVEGIAGPEQGRESLPFAGNRLGMAFVATFAYLGITPLGLLPPPWFFDLNRQTFESIVVPALHLNGWNLSVNFIIEAYMGFGMLISTLLYEKKVSQSQAAWLLVLNFFVSGAYDQFAVLSPALDAPRELLMLGDYAHSITSSLPLNESFVCLWAASLVKAMWDLNQLQRQTRMPEIQIPIEGSTPPKDDP